MIKQLLVPPASFIVLALLGLALTSLRPRTGFATMAAAVVLLYVFATPFAAQAILRGWQSPYAEPADCEAIVILAAGLSVAAPEFGGAAPDALTLERLRYGADLQRQTGAPVLVSGGVYRAGAPSRATVMAESLRRDFGVPARWQESESATTAENAQKTRNLLAPEGITRICLVTHAWHMPRAQLAFERYGFTAIPAATGFATAESWAWTLLIPSADALTDSYHALYEMAGYAAYRFGRLPDGG